MWGGPAQFTLDGTRRGVLNPAHYDDYVEYVATVVHFLVQRQGFSCGQRRSPTNPTVGTGTRFRPMGWRTLRTSWRRASLPMA